MAESSANTIWPRLVPYAPNIGTETLPALPNVAGRFDPSTQSVLINTARIPALSDQQTVGLVGLERSRGHLYSPLGAQWTDNFELTPEQRTWWDSFYLPPTVTAPLEQNERDRILKSTMLSRTLVGDQLPQGAPPLTDSQQQLSQLYSTYAKQR